MRGEASWDEALLHGKMKEQDRRSCVRPLSGILSLLMNIGPWSCLLIRMAMHFV